MSPNPFEQFYVRLSAFALKFLSQSPASNVQLPLRHVRTMIILSLHSSMGGELTTSQAEIQPPCKLRCCPTESPLAHLSNLTSHHLHKHLDLQPRWLCPQQGWSSSSLSEGEWGAPLVGGELWPWPWPFTPALWSQLRLEFKLEFKCNLRDTFSDHSIYSDPHSPSPPLTPHSVTTSHSFLSWHWPCANWSD